MGSFNTSCFVSRQTIAPSELCWVLPIAQQHGFNEVEVLTSKGAKKLRSYTDSNCYADRYWAPAGNFLQARYADYGAFELCDTPVNLRRLLAFLRVALTTTPAVKEGSNPYHEKAYDLAKFMAEKAPELLTHLQDSSESAPALDPAKSFEQANQCWDYVFEASRSGRLFQASVFGTLRPLAFAVMHDAAYHALIEAATTQEPGRYSGYSLEEGFKRLVMVSREGTECALKRYREEKADFTGDYAQAITQWLFKENVRQALLELGRGPASAQAELSEDLVHCLDPNVAENDLFEAVKPTLEVLYAHVGLEHLNLHYEPMVYAGQDYDNEIGMAYAALVQKVSKQVSRSTLHNAFGPALPYQVKAGSQDALDALVKRANQHDGYLEVISTRPSEDGTGLLAHIECPFEGEDLHDLLNAHAEHHGQTPAMSITLA